MINSYRGQLTPEQVMGYFEDLQQEDFGSHMALVHSTSMLKSNKNSNSSINLMNKLGMGIAIASSPDFDKMAVGLKKVYADIVSYRISLPEGATKKSESILLDIIESLESYGNDHSSVENKVNEFISQLKEEAEKTEKLEKLTVKFKLEEQVKTHEATIKSLSAKDVDYMAINYIMDYIICI